jgi:hypothetical protein
MPPAQAASLGGPPANVICPSQHRVLDALHRPGQCSVRGASWRGNARQICNHASCLPSYSFASIPGNGQELARLHLTMYRERPGITAHPTKSRQDRADGNGVCQHCGWKANQARLLELGATLRSHRRTTDDCEQNDSDRAGHGNRFGDVSVKLQIGKHSPSEYENPDIADEPLNVTGVVAVPHRRCSLRAEAERQTRALRKRRHPAPVYALDIGRHAAAARVDLRPLTLAVEANPLKIRS